MGKARVLIVDDEPLARRGLREMVEAEPDMCVVGECRDGIDAIGAIEEQHPDVLLLDVEMPGLNGFEVLDVVQPPPVVIFVTAFDQYAVNAFTVHAFDYLLKPVDPERFRESLGRARESLARASELRRNKQLAKLLETMRVHQDRPVRVAVRVSGKVVLLEACDIDWIEASGDYATIHSRGKKYLLRETIRNMETRLDGSHFLRVHRSTIVNTNRIKELQPTPHGDLRLTLKDGTHLNAGRMYRSRLVSIIKGGR